MRRILCLLTLAVMLLTVLPVAAEVSGNSYYVLGSTMNDFSVTTYDGRQVTLSETLKEKDMVLLNIWATWCGPCRMEFPYMQEAYAKYSDRVEIIAVSCEETDSNEKLKTFAEDMGLTFPVARDTAGLAYRFRASSIPTSVVIDRFGTVCYIGAGAVTNAETFQRLFDVFVGDDYAKSRVIQTIPVKPNIPAAEAEKLAAALNVPGGSLLFTNPADEFVWPMIPAEEDGRLCVMSTNKGVDDTQAKLYTTVTAQEGDALAFTFKTSSEAASDLLTLEVNGTRVKVFGGEKDWMTYAYAFPADGQYEIAFGYEKDAMGATGSDVVYIDEIALLTGDDVRAAVAANPAYPMAEAVTLSVLNSDAKQILFDDPTYALLSLFGLADYYIVPGGSVQLLATLDETVDPEGALLVNYYDGTVNGVIGGMTTEGYTYATQLDSVATTGYAYTNLHLYPSASCSIMDVRTVVCFASEADANAFVETMPAYGYNVTGWSYADGAEAATHALPGEGVDPAAADYTITFIDQQGEFISGVTVTVCDEESCEVMTSDEDGAIEFAGEPYPWEIHVIRAPEGCTFDPDAVWTLDADGGETIIALERTVVEEE
ncbi:MAG: TlpA family protein disulfide reductase [Clostridia bacterium]|nr:TlpA family protein disulfide reductase [Clostridia bacterium]